MTTWNLLTACCSNTLFAHLKGGAQETKRRETLPACIAGRSSEPPPPPCPFAARLEIGARAPSFALLFAEIAESLPPPPRRSNIYAPHSLVRSFVRESNVAIGNHDRQRKRERERGRASRARFSSVGLSPTERQQSSGGECAPLSLRQLNCANCEPRRESRSGRRGRNR
jgi:hypothetical protein